MKQRILTAAAALVVTASVHAQSTVDSIAAKYKLQPMPAALTLEQTFPVVGSYQLQNSTEGTGTVTVTLDSSNKGLVWVEGLPQGRLKAYLRKSPSTYRILSQKGGNGQQVQEGTLHYDTTTHELHVALGKAYNTEDPTAIFASSTDAAAGDDMSASTAANTSSESVTKAKSTQTKAKSKSSAGKSKAKVQFYTATKVMPDNMMDNTQTQTTDSTNQQ